MPREHGTRARYVGSPDQDGTAGRGCRCAPCTKANSADQSHRARMQLYGRWQPFTDAAPVRDHVRMLAAHGVGWRRVAALAGVSTGAMSKLLHGGPGDRPPVRRVRPETAAAILAITPSLATLAPHALAGAAGTHRRLQALVACGWSQNRLAARLGKTRANFGAMMNASRVTAATALAVQALYGELWDRPPPQATHREKIAASRARNYARGRGWPPPGAWDDDTIDDPGAAPPIGWARPRARRWETAALAEEAAEVLAQGHTREQAAERLGVSRAALGQALARACRERAS